MTPGPWASYGIYVLSHDAESIIAKASYSGKPFQEARANAYVLAAAPELLEALKAVVEVLQREAPGTPLNNHRFDALGIQAHNAIAKAEGR